MISFLADHNFNEQIVTGVRRRLPSADLLTARALGLQEATDADLLEYAAQQHRIVLTHDVNTLVGFASDRIRAGVPMPGVLVSAAAGPAAPIIEDVLLIIAEDRPGEWDKRITFLPL